jgi:hypothetical protein
MARPSESGKGDGNQEDITNDAIRNVWTATRCYRFEFRDNQGVDHMSLPGSPAVLERLLTHLQQPRSLCSGDWYTIPAKALRSVTAAGGKPRQRGRVLCGTLGVT